MQAQGYWGMAGMGSGGVRPSGKNWLTFDHILSRLQGELRGSREMGAELHLTEVMDELQLVQHRYPQQKNDVHRTCIYLVALRLLGIQAPPIGGISGEEVLY
jgi:hypothetical protein